MVRRVIGIIIALTSVATFILHIAKLGSAPHDLWALLTGIAFLIGLWLSFPNRSEGQ
jgi:uncharacterized membrane protein YczE